MELQQRGRNVDWMIHLAIVCIIFGIGGVCWFGSELDFTGNIWTVPLLIAFGIVPLVAAFALFVGYYVRSASSSANLELASDTLVERISVSTEREHGGSQAETRPINPARPAPSRRDRFFAWLFIIMIVGVLYRGAKFAKKVEEINGRGREEAHHRNTGPNGEPLYKGSNGERVPTYGEVMEQLRRMKEEEINTKAPQVDSPSEPNSSMIEPEPDDTQSANEQQKASDE